MSGAGTGVPNWFMCPVLRRIWPRTDYHQRGHVVTRTGRVRPRNAHGKMHPRMLKESHEFICTCGHTGWSAHKGVLQCPVAA